MLNFTKALEKETVTPRVTRMEFDHSWVENKYDFFNTLDEEIVLIEVKAKFYNAPYSAKYEVVMDLTEEFGMTFKSSNVIEYSMAKSQFEKMITAEYGLSTDLLEGRYARMTGSKKQLKKIVVSSAKNKEGDEKVSARVAIQRITLD